MAAVQFLPETAWTDGVVAEALQSACATWLQNWLPIPVAVSTDTWLIGGASEVIGQKEEPVLSLNDPSSLITLGVGQKSLDCLLATIMGVPFLFDGSNEIDRQFAQQLLDDALNELGQQMCLDVPGLSRLEILRGTDAVPANNWHHGFTISWQSKRSKTNCGQIWGTLDPTLAARMRLALIAHPDDLGISKSDLQRGSLMLSAKEQLVAVDALIGRSKITAADVATLQPGDVLVLDRSVTSELEVTVNGRTVNNLACKPIVEHLQPIKLELRMPRQGVSH